MSSSSESPGVVEALSLAARYGDEVVLRTVRETHEAVAGRAFGTLGEAGRVARLVHDGVCGAVYSGLELALAGTGAALHAAGAGGPRLSPRVQSAVTGVVGDRLRADAHPLHFEMAPRRWGRDVPVDEAGLAAAYPSATDKIVVFVHGLCESESAWHGRPAPGYAVPLSRAGWSPVFLRYNSGLGVRENGAALSSLMQSLVDRWPLPVRRVALVGHSMGGLVIRAGCAVNTPDADAWTDLVTDVVYLGTPHLGAPLARQASMGSALLKLFPESAALGRVIDHRSVGITDLETGLTDDVPSLAHARVRLVSAQLGGVAGRLLGDLLVRQSSAYGRNPRSPELFPEADVVHLVDTHHFGLLNHPEVHTRLEEWLA